MTELEILIKKRLEILGYTGAPTGLAYLIAKTKQSILNITNLLEVPGELTFVWADMVVGEYLAIQKAQGKLENFDAEGAVKQVKQGDTTITYAIPEHLPPIDALIHYLTCWGRDEILGFRRMVW